MLVNVISLVGNYSFEIFLVHAFLFEYFYAYIENHTVEHGNLIWIFAFLCIIPLVILLRWISNIIRRVFRI